MAVSVNATGTGKTGVATTTGFTEASSSITVAAGSNTVLCLVLQLSAAPAVNPTVTWDNGGTNQTMTFVGKQAASDGSSVSYIYGLIAPTTGAKLLKVAWVTTSADWTYGMMAFNGALQTSVAATFKNFTSGNPATGSGANQIYPPTTGISVTTASGDMAIAGAGSSNDSFGTTGVVGTQFYTLLTNVSGAGIYHAAVGASTNIRFDSASGGQTACWAACDIAAAASDTLMAQSIF